MCSSFSSDDPFFCPPEVDVDVVLFSANDGCGKVGLDVEVAALTYSGETLERSCVGDLAEPIRPGNGGPVDRFVLAANPASEVQSPDLFLDVPKAKRPKGNGELGLPARGRPDSSNLPALIPVAVKQCQ